MIFYEALSVVSEVITDKKVIHVHELNDAVSLPFVIKEAILQKDDRFLTLK
jgi:hypothetical protein